MKNKSLLKLTAIVAAILLAFQSAGAVVCFAQEDESYTRHTVVSGETLSHIAKKYGVTIDEIAKLNNIGNINFIATGTVLKIPSTQNTAAETEPKEIADTAAAAADAVAAPAVSAPAPSVTTAGFSAAPHPAQTAASQPARTKTAAGSTVTKTSTVTSTPSSTESDSTDTEASEGDYRSMLASFDTKVSIAFSNADILDVLTVFAESLGYNIIYIGGSSRNVNLNMKDISMGEAFEYVLKINNLSYTVKGNTIIVGSKDSITNSFIEEARITEFTLTYVTADVIIGYLNTFNIPVTATPLGEGKNRFLVQGLPEDLARVRNLISMVDRRENAVSSGTKSASSFYAIEVTNVTAAEFQRILNAATLPSGVILSSRPQTLYVFASPEEYSSIKSIKAVVDVAGSSTSEDLDKIVEKTLKYLTVDLIESQIRSNSAVTIIKISTNNTKMWLRGKAKDIADAEKIIALLDKPENASKDEVQLVEKFTPVVTKFITAVMLRDTISRLAIDAITVVYEANPKTLYVYATDENLQKIHDLIKIIDTQDNAGIEADEVLALFKPVSCTFISAEQFNTVLRDMSLPTGLIFEDNPKTLFIYATESDFAKILELLNIVDIKDNENATLAAKIKSVTLRHITAEQLNRMLSGMSLPTGLYYDYNPYVLYLNVNDAQYKEICEVAAYVDTLENSRAGSFDIYFIDLYYTNVDKAVEFIGQLGLSLDVIRLSNAQKRLWLMGEYTEYLKARSAITAIDVPSASLTYSFKTFTLISITAGEAKKLIDNASLTGVLTYIPNGDSNGNKLVIYYPNDAVRDIENLVRKIDDPLYQSTFRKVLETLDAKQYRGGSTSDNPNDWTKVTDRIEVLSRLSNVAETHFVIYNQLVTDPNDSSKQFVVIYLEGVTTKQYNDVLEVKNMLTAPTSGSDDDSDEESAGITGFTEGEDGDRFFYDYDEIMNFSGLNGG